MYFNAWNTFAILPAVYATVFLGLTDFPRSALISSGDYSYGVYLYSGPIQQAVVSAFPDHRTWWENLLISAPFIVLAAVGSCHLVEKQVLRLRPLLAIVEGRWVIIRDRGLKALAKGAQPSS